MPPTLTQITDPAEKSAICDGILRALPHWFGIEASIVDYVRQVADLPFWAVQDGAPRGLPSRAQWRVPASAD